MNGAQLQAFVTEHKTELAAGGAVLVGGLALARRRKTAAATPVHTSTSAQPGLSAASGAAYDSSASDVYNAIQPELEQLRNLMTQQTPPTPAPAAAPPAPIFAPAPAPAAIQTAVPAPAPAPAAGTHDQYYVVQRGDTLSGIAARYPQANITWQSIYRDNSNTIGGDANKIRPGMGLAIRGINN